MSTELIDAAHHIARSFPAGSFSDAVALLKKSGVLAAHVPAHLGGPELAPSDIAEITRILATADGSLAQVPQSHFTFTRWLFSGEHPELEQEWAERLLGGALVANAQAEFDAVTYADGQVSGTKKWCTGSIWADFLAVTARRPGDEEQSLCAFLPVGQPGVQVVDDWDGLGQRRTGSGTVHFDRVAVETTYSRSCALALPAYGAFAQLLHTAIDVGIMQAAVGEMSRRLQGVAEDRLLHHQAGELVQRSWVAEACLRQAGEAVDGVWNRSADPHRAALAVAAAKSWVAESAVDVASRVYELLGASHATGSGGADVYWRDLRTHTLHDRRREKLEILGRAAITGEKPELGTKL